MRPRNAGERGDTPMIATFLFSLVLAVVMGWLFPDVGADGLGLALILPNGLATVRKSIGTITNTSPANANSFFLDIPRDFPLVQLLLDVSGTLNSAAGTTNGTPVDENPMTYLRKIYLNLSGGPASLQLKNYKGIQAYRLHHLFESREP